MHKDEAMIPSLLSRERGLSCIWSLTEKMPSKEELKKLIKELRARAKLERTMAKLRKLQEQAQADANKLPIKQPVKKKHVQ